MKEYPSIPTQIHRDLVIYAFDKIDGSNIRAEWSRKAGFYKFGSRTVLLDSSHDFLGEAPDIIRAKYEQALSDIFRKQRVDKAICFFEFFGPNSFAGQHKQELHDVVLIDVNPHKKGIDPPSDFIRLYGKLDIPKCVYIGKANYDFERGIKEGLIPGVTFEGVVCKGCCKGRHLTMFKIKSQVWLNKLTEFCAGDEKKFRELA